MNNVTLDGATTTQQPPLREGTQVGGGDTCCPSRPLARAVWGVGWGSRGTLRAETGLRLQFGRWRRAARSC